MKKFIVILALLLLMTGCSSSDGYQVTKAVGEVSTPEMLAMNYENFDGTKFGDFYPVAEGETVEFQVYVETIEGSLTIYITPEEDENTVVYEAEDIPTSEFTFVIDEPGVYSLYISAENHKGGYTITTTRTMN